jgi:hypothetical protein
VHARRAAEGPIARVDVLLEEGEESPLELRGVLGRLEFHVESTPGDHEDRVVRLVLVIGAIRVPAAGFPVCESCQVTLNHLVYYAIADATGDRKAARARLLCSLPRRAHRETRK